jgi:chromosome condensin MukBEF ATPase and DNA-binding subunit MukB
LAAFKEEVGKKDKALTEQDELFAAEKKKAEFNAAKLKESEEEVAQLKAQAIELKATLDAKDDEMTAKLMEAGYDAYREAVRSIVFLNLGVELNLRGLDPFHGVKNGQFWDFHDH